jgi:hypothetical protein
MTVFKVLRKTVAGLAPLLAILTLGASAGSAETLKPWLHLTSGARPMYLHPGVAQDAVQKLTVSAETGQYVVEYEGREHTLTVGEPSREVREALEKLYGADNLEVSSDPGPYNAHEVYEVKFVDALKDRPVVLVVKDVAVAGGTGKVEAHEIVKGRPDGEVVAFAENLGDATIDGATAPLEVVDTLPAHVKALAAFAGAPEETFGTGARAHSLPCAVESSSRVSCRLEGTYENVANEIVPSTLAPYEQIEVRIAVEVEPDAESGEANEVATSGGEAAAASLRRPLTISSVPTPGGVEDYELVNESAGASGGGPDLQAGSHPFQQTTTIDLNQEADTNPLENAEDKPKVEPAASMKDLSFKWPAGLIGNPAAVARCPLSQFLTKIESDKLEINACPADSAVGVAVLVVEESTFLGHLNIAVPVFNLEPLNGEPARFGFDVATGNTQVYIDPSLRSGSDYGITVSSDNITQTAGFLSAKVTVWGVPGAPEHAADRGWTGDSPEEHPPAFLSLPTSCTGPSVSTVEGDSWSQADERQKEGLPPQLELLGEWPMPGLVGCNRLPFVPEIKVSADVPRGSTPSGLTVDVHVPQEGQLNGSGLAQSNVKDIMVTLPQGVALNPSAADGLEGCSEGQIGYLPAASHPPSELHFTPYRPGSTDALAAGDREALEPGKNFCPNASKIAEVAITTPLLPKGQTVKGFVYLASPQNFDVFPQENPFEKHVAMYIVAEDPVSGSLLKLPGKVELGGQPGVEGLAPGQIRSTFEDNPQLAFEDAELHFFGGERAPLATPSRCGTYTTDATFTPWSGGPPVSSQSSFEITSGPNGTPCPGSSLPFNPSLASGTTNINAGSFTPLTTTLSREDGQQPIQSVTLHYPAGVSGLLAGVKLCGEAEANTGTCGPESEIGETIVSVGLGGDPFTVTGGRAYITGPYDGAPFGLSIVNPAKAGPFDLQQGRPVVVRAKIEVDPHTAALTITTDPPGSPYAIPTIIEGFPLQIKHVNVLVNRPDFTFNPTNCTPATVTGAIDSAEGASSPVSVPFQATNCASLQFAPKFAVATSGKNSKAYGTSLAVKLTYPTALFGSQANIKQVKVELPEQLPSRLTTLQKACTAAQFDANPAGCPAASVIGHAKAITPLIPVPLEGPAYFVSNGGEAFPNLIIVLQGYGVTIDLVGDTFISKTGVTSSTFKTVPDAPVGSFELVLPEGKYSALTALGNLCTEKLTMPTEFLAQNGMALHQSTPVSVTGCAKAKALTKTQKLAKALKACKADHNKAKRSSCEKAARKHYGTAKTKKKAKKK